LEDFEEVMNTLDQSLVTVPLFVNSLHLNHEDFVLPHELGVFFTEHSDNIRLSTEDAF
jgi:hypothetical protein